MPHRARERIIRVLLSVVTSIVGPISFIGSQGKEPVWTATVAGVTSR